MLRLQQSALWVLMRCKSLSDLAALQSLGGVGRGDGGAQLVRRFAQQGDHVTVGVVAVPHHLVRLHRLVQDVAEVGAL